MVDTLNLAVPLLTTGQAQKEVTHNDALVIMDALVQNAVISRTTTTPPTGVEGALYIVATSSTGVWAGQDDNIAHYINGAWAFYTPKEGWMFTVTDEASAIVRYLSGAWTKLAVGTSGVRTDTATSVTILTTDSTVFCNPSAPATASLPLATNTDKYTIVNVSANAVTVGATAADVASVSGLVAGYHFNSDVTAFTGAALDGTPTAITYNTATPLVGTASAKFDGATSTISVADDPALAFGTGAFTIYAWFKKAADGTAQVIASKVASAVVPGFWVYADNASNALAFYTGDGTSHLLTSTTTVTGTGWHLAVFKRDGAGNKTIKIDNVLDASTGNDGSKNIDSATAMTLGSGYAGEFLNGEMDEMLFHNIATLDADDTIFWKNGAGIEVDNLLVGCMANYHFNSDVLDSSDNGFNGTPTAITYDTTAPKLGSASAIFNGTSSIVTIPDDPLLDFTTDYTIALWVNHTALSGTYDTFLAKGAGGYAVGALSTGIVYFGLEGVSDTSSVTALGTGTWTCVICIHTAGTNFIYIGDPTTADSSGAHADATANANSLVLGKGPTSGFFNGEMDEVTLWNRALTQAERLDYWNAGAGREVASISPPTINGTATHPLSTQYAAATYQSDGTNYFVVG